MLSLSFTVLLKKEISFIVNGSEKRRAEASRVLLLLLTLIIVHLVKKIPSFIMFTSPRN
jgi:hypothetical protein